MLVGRVGTAPLIPWLDNALEDRIRRRTGDQVKVIEADQPVQGSDLVVAERIGVCVEAVKRGGDDLVLGKVSGAEGQDANAVLRGPEVWISPGCPSYEHRTESCDDFAGPP